jgi:hypothetical protein
LSEEREYMPGAKAQRLNKEREYMPGDVVRMELRVENDGANLDNAFARFVHEGEPQFHVILTQDVAAMIREEAADGATENRVLVEATVPASIPEGEYVLEQVHVRCASGRIYRFTREMLPDPGARFRVVREPCGRMVLKGATLMD